MRTPLHECLVEVSKGVGPDWSQYRLLGATRAGLAAGKEAIGKSPERYKLVLPGSIFYNPMRILLGSIAFLDEGDAPGITSPDYVVFETRNGVLHPRFFYHWLRSVEGDAFIRSLARGAVRERLLFRRLVSGSLEIPPWEVQKKTADQLAVVEHLRAAADAQLGAVNGLLAFVLEEVFENTTARRWPHVVLGTVAETCSGTTPPRSRPDYYVGEIPWIKTGELKDGDVSESEEHVSDAALHETSLRLLPPGTLLVAMYGQGQTRGRTGLLTTNATTNQACLAVLPSDRIEGRFLQWWFRHNYTRIRQETTARGGSQPNLSGAYLRNQAVPLPPPAEQREIAQTLAGKEMAVLRLSTPVQAEIAAIKALPTALLRRAFSGES